LGMHCYETRLECKGLACRSLLAIAQADQGPRVERTACLTVKTPRRWKGHSGSMPAVRPPPAPVGHRRNASAKRTGSRSFPSVLNAGSLRSAGALPRHELDDDTH